MKSDIFFANDDQFDKIISSMIGRTPVAEGPEFDFEDFISDTLEDDIYGDIYGDIPGSYVFEA